MDLAGLPLRAERFYRDNESICRLGEQALRIDLRRKRVELSSGGAAPFDHLILATGARPRPLEIPGARSRRRPRPAQHRRRAGDSRTARAGPARRGDRRGIHRPGDRRHRARAGRRGRRSSRSPIGRWARAVSPSMSSFFLEAHQAFGATFRLGVGVAAIKGAAGAAEAVDPVERRAPAGGRRHRRRRRARRGPARARGGPGLRQRRRRRRMARRFRSGRLRNRRLRAIPPRIR